MSATAWQEDSLIVREPQGERRFASADFPLAIGGAGSVIVLAGRPDGVEAWIGVHEDQLFVQPAEGAEVLHNGVGITQSSWLKAGDVVNLGAARLRVVDLRGQRVVEVDDGSAGNITAPPVVSADARLRGDSDSEAEPLAAVRFRASEAAKQRRAITFSPTRILLSAIVVIGAAILWFVLTSTSIAIVTNPTQARVDVIGGLPAVPVGGRFLLRPGNYTLRATLAGYKPAEWKVKVTEAADQRFALTLAKLPGLLTIDVPVKAQVVIDGAPPVEAPGEFELPPGAHSLAINAPRYQPFVGTVDVEGLGKKQAFKAVLVPSWANVTVTSEPTGAQVSVGGEVRGTTPLTTEVMAGNQPLAVSLAGFKTWTTDIQVKANEAMTVGPVRLGLPDGRLALRSEPSGASVSISGVYRGQTPLDVDVRPDIAQSIVLTRAGYESATRQITLRSGEKQTISVALAGVFGEVAVRAQPADAEILVDGRSVGAVNQTLRLVATTHDIVIRKAGFVDYKTSVTPRPGLPQVVETKLLTAEQTRIASTPTVVATKASSQQLKLMPLGRFTMGSPRREPGRRANEAQRDVEFKRAFYIGVREVTNAEFKRFKADHRSGIVPPNTLELDNQPAVNLRWEQAAAYCNWLSEQEGLKPAYVKDGDSLVPANPMTNGYRLPTDAEWEWAARNAGGGKLRRYPWGDALPVAPASGNYADYTARAVLQDIVPNYDDGFAVSAPVGKFPPNSFGLYDMGGNAAEWAHDYYTVSVDGSQVLVDPMGPGQGKNHVIRGSSWKQAGVTDLRLSARDFSDSVRNDVGFRVARYAE